MNQYIFTPTGFYPDTQEKETLEKRYETLYHMGFSKRSKEMSSSELFLYELSETFFRCLTEMPELELTREATHVVPDEEHLEHLLSSVPYAIGAEYIDRKWIAGVFSQLEQIFQREISGYKGSVELYLTEQNQKLHVPERIFLHLVENKDGEDPFVFMATYASLGEDHAVHHMPLKYALTEYQDDRDKLLALLSCLNRAAEVSDLIAELVESGEMFHVLRFTGKEAYQFLRDVEKIEQTGILCRIPNWWRKRAMECSVEIRLGEKKPAMVGFDSLISMQPQLCVDGEALTKKDVELLLAQTEGLAFLKGKWVEVNHKKLRELLKRMDGMDTSITLREALQMEIGNGKKDFRRCRCACDQRGMAFQNVAQLAKTIRYPFGSSAENRSCNASSISEGWVYVAELYAETGIWCMPGRRYGTWKNASGSLLSRKDEKIRQRRKNAFGRSGIPDRKLAEGGSKVCPGYDASGYSRKDICAACTGI